MHFTTSTTVALLSIIASVSAADSTTTASAVSSGGAAVIPVGNPGGSGYKTPDEAAIKTKIQAMASSQITESAVKAQLSTISQTKGHDLASDIAAGAQAANSGKGSMAPPAWVTAAGKGPVSSVYYGDQSSFFNQLLEAAGATGTTGSSKPASTASSKAASTASSKSSSGGAGAQPTGPIMAAGAAAAGVLGFAAML